MLGIDAAALKERLVGNDTQNQSAAETARLLTQPKPPIDNQSVAESARLNRAGIPAITEPENRYVHDSDDTIVNSSDLSLNLKIQPNILDQYDVVTYHWKLFITDPDSSSTGDIFNVKNQTIIAETGITDLTIDKVEISSQVTPNTESGTGIATFVKFEILEPSGAGLIDKLFYQSIALGIGNWNTMPVYLQLQFKNRDVSASAPDEGSVGSLASLKWLWTTKMTSIKAHVSSIGTRYEFAATVYNEFAQSNAIFTMKQNTTLADLTTFGRAMEQLQTKLNDNQMSYLISDYSIPDSFKIVVDPTLAGYNISTSNKNTNTRRNDNYVKFGNKDASFASGTAVDKVIDALLSNTDEMQTGMTSAPQAGANGVSINSESSQMKQFWRIITETRPLQYDPQRSDVAKEFTIFVVAYDIGILDENILQTSNGPSTLEAERRRLATYLKKSILKKQYNYIFTGQNDQIINFDLTLNNAFAAAQARFGGIYSNAAMTDKGVVTHNHSADEAKVTSALSAAISMQNSATPTSSAPTRQAVLDAQFEIDASNLPEDVKTRYTTLLENAKPENRVSFMDRARTSGLAADGSFAATRRNAVNLAKPVTEQITQEQYNFLSDIDINSDLAKSQYTELMQRSKEKLRPIARYSTDQDRQIGLGVESNSNSGLQKLSNMFSVALHSGMDTAFTRINLTIKGDPFWIFPQPFTGTSVKIFNSLKPESEAIEWIKKAHFKQTDAVNILATDNFLILRIRTPKVYDADYNPDDTDQNVDVQTFSGIYKVITIINKFSGGKFTQELTCNIDPEIMLLNVMDQINAANSVPIPAARPTDLMTSQIIPETAVMGPRIMGSADDVIQQPVGEIGTVLAGSNSNIPSPDDFRFDLPPYFGA